MRKWLGKLVGMGGSEGLGALLPADGRVWRRWCGSWRGGAGLLVLALTVYLPGFWSIPPVDRDESRFAQASRQMFEAAALPEAERDPAMHSGGWVVPMVQGRARLNKPPGIYWLQAASAWVLTGGDPMRDAIWMYRVPSLIAGLVTVLVTWRIGLSMFDARAAWLGAGLLAVSPVFVWEAHQARADMVMVAATTVGVWGLWNVIRKGPESTIQRSPTRKRGSCGAPVVRACSEKAQQHSSTTAQQQIKVEQQSSRTAEQQTRNGGGSPTAWGWPVWMWVAIGAGIMVKGPITPMVVGLTAVGYAAISRDWRSLARTRPVLGLAIVVALVAPWVWAVAQRTGFETYAKIVYDEVIGRSGGAKEGHWGPPGYHTLFMLAMFWPGCMLTGLGVWRAWGRAWRVWRDRGGAEQQSSGTAKQQIRAGASGGAGPCLRASSASGFLLAWLIPSWIVFELVMTKLPHYTMPMYPALALLSGRAVFAAGAGRLRGVRHWLASVGLVAWSIGCAVVAAVAVAVVSVAMILSPVAADGVRNSVMQGLIMAVWIVGVAVGVAVLVRCGSWMRRGRFVAAQVLGVGVIACLAVMALHFAMPVMLDLSPNIAREVEELDPTATRPVAAVRYHEDSLLFLTRGRLDRIDEDQVRTWVDGHPRGLVVAPWPDRGPGETWGLRRAAGTHGTNITRDLVAVGMVILETGDE